MRNHVLIAAGVLNVGLEQREVQQISHAQAPAAHLVLVSRANAAGGGPNLYPSRRIFSGEFDQAMVRQDYMRAVADEEVAVHLDAGVAERADFLEECHGVEDDSVANDAAATGTQNAAGHQLQNELLAIDDDSVSGIVAAGIAGHDGEVLREHVDDFAFALVAPLGANDDHSFPFFQMPTPRNRLARPPRAASAGRTHSLPAPKTSY